MIVGHPLSPRQGGEGRGEGGATATASPSPIPLPVSIHIHCKPTYPDTNPLLRRRRGACPPAAVPKRQNQAARNLESTSVTHDRS